MIWPTLDPVIGIPILWVCLAVFCLAVALWVWPARKSELGHNPESGRLSQRPSYLAEQQAYRDERARQRAIDDAEKGRRTRKDDSINRLIDMFKELTTKPNEMEVAEKEARDAETFQTQWGDVLSNKVPFTRIRHDAPQFGLILDDKTTSAQNLASNIEGAMGQAAVDGKLKVWGRKYRGLIKYNDPLVEIPASHFEDYGFMHGCLHYAVPNEKTATGTIQMLARAEKGEEGVTYYDLWISYDDARRILTQIAKAQSA